MFTGLIAGIGHVSDIQGDESLTTLTIAIPESLQPIAIGDSVAINGVCLTAIHVTEPTGSDLATSVAFEVMGETLNRTNIGQLQLSDLVNLERPAILGGTFLDGHIVQGHVDTIASVSAIEPHDKWTTFTFTLPTQGHGAHLERYIVEKGSIAINGVSLTVTAITRPADNTPAEVSVGIIPHTLTATNFQSLQVGSLVNIEADILAKHIEALLIHSQKD